MATPRERVALTSPNGAFSVFVSPSRAVTLQARGYRLASARSTAESTAEAPKRPQLNARAKELGIPASGTNVELQKAIAEAEAAAASTGG